MGGYLDFLRGVETGDLDPTTVRQVARDASSLADGVYRVLTNNPPEELRGIVGAGVTASSVFGGPAPLLIMQQGWYAYPSRPAGFRSDATDVLGEQALGVLDERLRSLGSARQDDWRGLLHNTEARILPPLNLTWGSGHQSRGTSRGTFGATVILPGGGNKEAVLTAGHVVGQPGPGPVDDLDDHETGKVVKVQDPCGPSAQTDGVYADVAAVAFSPPASGPHHPASLRIDDFRDGRANDDVTFHLHSGTRTSKLDAFLGRLKYSSSAPAYAGSLWLTTDCQTKPGDSGAAVTVTTDPNTEELIGHVIGDYRDVHDTGNTHHSVIQSVLWQLGALSYQLAKIP